MTREEVINLMLKDSNPKDVHSYINSDNGVQVFVSGKPNTKKLAKLLVEICK